MAEEIKNIKNPRNKPSFQFKYVDSDEANGQKALTPDVANDNEDLKKAHKTIRAALGASDSNYANHLFTQIINALGMNKTNPEKVEMLANCFFNTLYSLKPQDELEGMLISRMLVLHNQGMDLLIKATNSEYVQQAESYTNRSIKLMRLYNETLETLNRYRRKGEQKVTVQHVNVNTGGQAIVSGEFNPGGDNSKK